MEERKFQKIYKLHGRTFDSFFSYLKHQITIQSTLIWSPSLNVLEKTSAISSIGSESLLRTVVT